MNKILWVMVVSMLGLAACGSGTPKVDGECSDDAKAKATEVLRSYWDTDAMTMPEEITQAIAAGCESSQSDQEAFLQGFLADLGLDPDCAADEVVQHDAGEIEGVSEDIPGTCGVAPDVVIPPPSAPECTVDADCASDKTCSAGTCVNKPKPVTAEEIVEFTKTPIEELVQDEIDRLPPANEVGQEIAKNPNPLKLPGNFKFPN